MAVCVGLDCWRYLCLHIAVVPVVGLTPDLANGVCGGSGAIGICVRGDVDVVIWLVDQVCGGAGGTMLRAVRFGGRWMTITTTIVVFDGLLMLMVMGMSVM